MNELYFTKRDIMDLLCICSQSFDYWVKKLSINQILVEENKMFAYSVNQLILIYEGLRSSNFPRKKTKILDSKMNFKEMKL